MTNYANGYRFERQIASQLENDGYWTIQARGSHGIADVVGVKVGEVVMVQAKLGRMPHDEWNELLRVANLVGAVPLVADKPRPGRIRYRRITGTHIEKSRTWPCEEWTADRAEAA